MSTPISTAPTSGTPKERFDLARFVLDFLEKEGSIVAPPAFGIYETLLPEDLADSLGIDDFVHLSFNSEQSASQPDLLRLSVNHPLVETIAEQVADEPANAMAYINAVRLQKSGLLELALKEFGFPNARMDGLPKAQEAQELHHYVQLNFKITIVSEEKQEAQASVIMDLQAGHPVTDPDQLRLLAILESQSAFDTLPTAAPRWAGAGDPLAEETLRALLPRAERCLRTQLADRLDGVATRIQHYLELDLARIEEYYDDLAGDIRRRRARLDETDVDRIQAMDEKLAALTAEQRKKLDDVQGRYALRVDMELVNVLHMVQPKITLPVTIANRTASIRRTVVWDPLFHHLEPLVCDVCGLPGLGLTLCTGGHLAHESCLAPSCIDCKRAFCQLCASQIQECVVCHEPVCRPSLIKCPTCGRGTCREHQTLCHADEGQPATLPPPAPVTAPVTAPPEAPPVAPVSPPAQPPPPKSSRTNKGSSTKSKTVMPSWSVGKPAPKPANPPGSKGLGVRVEIFEHELTVIAFVIRSSNRVWATRSFELTPQGILVYCECEKESCSVNGYYFRPWPQGEITEQIQYFIESLCQEYLVPYKKVTYYRQRLQERRKVDQFFLPDMWHNTVRLAEATLGFDSMKK